MPGQPVGAVRTDARRKLGVQQQPPGRAELGEGRQHSPADEQVAVASGLRVALRRGQQPLRLVVGADEGRDPGAEIQLHGDRAAVRQQRSRLGRLVVEERVLAVPDGLGIVLEGEDLAGPVKDLSGGGGLQMSNCLVYAAAPAGAYRLSLGAAPVTSWSPGTTSTRTARARRRAWPPPGARSAITTSWPTTRAPGPSSRSPPRTRRSPSAATTAGPTARR